MQNHTTIAIRFENYCAVENETGDGLDSIGRDEPDGEMKEVIAGQENNRKLEAVNWKLVLRSHFFLRY